LSIGVRARGVEVLWWWGRGDGAWLLLGWWRIITADRAAAAVMVQIASSAAAPRHCRRRCWEVGWFGAVGGSCREGRRAISLIGEGGRAVPAL
jgi:hypothetical protein